MSNVGEFFLDLNFEGLALVLKIFYKRNYKIVVLSQRPKKREFRQFLCRGRATTVKKCSKKCAARAKLFCCFFAVPVAVVVMVVVA